MLLPEIEWQRIDGNFGLKAVIGNKRASKDLWEVGRLQDEHQRQRLNVDPETLERIMPTGDNVRKQLLSGDTLKVYAAILISVFSRAAGNDNSITRLVGTLPDMSLMQFRIHLTSLCRAAGLCESGTNQRVKPVHYERLFDALRELQDVWVAPLKGRDSVPLIRKLDVKELKLRLEREPESLHQSVYVNFVMDGESIKVGDTECPTDLFNLQGLQRTVKANSRAARAANDLKGKLYMQLHREANENKNKPVLTFTLERLVDFADLRDVLERQRKPAQCRRLITAALDALQTEGLLTYRIEVANKAKKQPLQFRIVMKTGPDTPAEYAPENPLSTPPEIVS